MIVPLLLVIKFYPLLVALLLISSAKWDLFLSSSSFWSFGSNWAFFFEFRLEILWRMLFWVFYLLGFSHSHQGSAYVFHMPFCDRSLYFPLINAFSYCMIFRLFSLCLFHPPGFGLLFFLCRFSNSCTSISWFIVFLYLFYFFLSHHRMIYSRYP